VPIKGLDVLASDLQKRWRSCGVTLKFQSSSRVGRSGQMPQGREGGSPQMKDLSDRTKQLGIMGGAGAAVFGDNFEVGRDIEQRHVDDLQRVRLFDARLR
jgi:hypothetical protein